MSYRDDRDALLAVPSSHLRLDDEAASRMHAVIESTADGVVIIDLGSTSGTIVNGARVTKAALQHGDRIEIGRTTILIGIGAAAT